MVLSFGILESDILVLIKGNRHFNIMLILLNRAILSPHYNIENMETGEDYNEFVCTIFVMQNVYDPFKL